MTSYSALRRAPDGELDFVLRLPAHPLSVSVARHAIRGLKPWMSPDRCDRLELITSEAVTNALLHGSQTVEDVIEYELHATPSSVRGRVGDSGPEFVPPENQPPNEQVGGYGLIIIAQLAASWELSRSANGNHLHFTV